MKDNSIKIEQRLQNMKKFYLKAESIIDELPDSIPDNAKIKIKYTVLGDKDLKELMDGIDSHRPPRIFLIGRTGVGKSSLINALCGKFVADVSDTESCTEYTQRHICKEKNRIMMEILDTRGIAESKQLNQDVSAEDMLIEDITKFSPDVAILVLSCSHRDDVNSDVKFLKKVASIYEEINKVRLPIVVVINRADEIAPQTQKDPHRYPENKISKIKEIERNYKEIIIENTLKIDDIIAVSSLIEWHTPNGEYIDVEKIECYPKNDIENMLIGFDGRYKIEELLDILEGAILDCEARMGLRMAARLNIVVERLAKHLKKVFSGIAATVAVTPIPVSDIYILFIVQSMLVLMIAALSGRDISLETAGEFILGIGGIGGLGYSLRLIAQQASKLLNTVIPGSGSAVSSIVAASGTSAIGTAAITYFIDDKTLEDAKRKFEEAKNKE